MDEFSVSVIIPNFNNERYLARCINSILEQSLTPNEIVVVDDCSTDNSREVIESFEKRYDCVKGVYLEKNQGVSNARNMGVSVATSEYVTFTDSDDFYYSKDKLKNEMELIKKYHRDGEDILAYSAVVKVDEQGKTVTVPPLKKSRFFNGNSKLDMIARIKTDAIPRDYCVKKSIVEDVGAYSFYKNFYEDLDLLMRLSGVVKFYSTYQYGIAYRMTSGGLSKRRQEEHISTVNEIVNSYKKDLNDFEKVCVKVKNIHWRAKKKLFLK